MNKQQLASKIWALANELRGKVPAATYKDYMLGFLFYKYLSDREENYLIKNLGYERDELHEVKEDDEQPKKNCMDNLGYFIAYKNLFSTWINLGVDFSVENVTVALSAFERHISPAYKKVFSNIFATLSSRITDLGSTDPERTKNAGEIIKLVKSIPTDNREDYDVLGFVYEYLLKNFAANAGKAGEFYTPHEASVIMAEIIAYNLQHKETLSIYDPTSGSGSLLINIGQAVSGYLGDKNKIKYYAQELIPETYNLTRMNLVMRDILPGNIVARKGNTLEKDWPYFEDGDPDSTYDYLSVDACCSNPPYSQPWEPREDPRFSGYGLAPKSKADYAFLLHNLYHLNSEGIMTIVLPHGVLFRGGEEGTIREQLVRKHNIDTIIGLPANLFYGTGIPTIIMILRKVRERSDILFIDASKGFIKDGNKNKLRQRDIRKIVDTVISRKNIDRYSRLVSFDEIKQNEFNLNIPRYVDSSDKVEPHDIFALMYGGIPNAEINSENLAPFWRQFPTLKNELFKAINSKYSVTAGENLKEIIENNADVASFISFYNNKFSYLKTYLENEFLSNPASIHLSSLEMKIAASIREKIDDNGLIDYYDCFEALDNVWQEILLDLETVKTQGFAAAKEIDDIKVLKKDSKTKKLEEKVIGTDGRLIPFAMIQNLYFSDLADEVSALDIKISALANEKDELLDSIESYDKAELLKDGDSSDIDSKKLKSKIAEIKKNIKKGAEYEDDSYESIIMSIDETNNKISQAKKALKTKKTVLDSETEEKIKTLTDEEIHNILVKKWIDPICDGITNLPHTLIASLESQIDALSKKYDTSFTELDSQIIAAESSLSGMLDDLTGNDFDMQGLAELKKLLGGSAK